MRRPLTALALAAVLTGALAAPAAAEPAGIPRDFLLYEKAARQDPRHWHWSDHVTELWNIQCSSRQPTGWVAAREVSYDRRPGGGEAANALRGEQVLLFADQTKAAEVMRQFRDRLAECGTQVKSRTPKLGDEAVGATRRIEPTRAAPIPQTQRFVAVRRGAAVALYWDMHNDAPALRTMARHERDARRMAAKLCDIGGC
ncbi:hypothetical protein [Thermoactinospora rubra]|uniref:hypothetical protein n=1 Tax=Thermoactinospora rubra TaxID=1088767 RepID=UPI000A117BE1|nr:hypothetical protein [Thermoactinospora rubra]